MLKVLNLFKRIFTPPSSFVIKIIPVICLLVLVFDKWEGLKWRANIHSDGKGYYAYLPAIFIYNDLQYKFEETILPKYESGGKEEFYCTEFESKKVNKYFAGTALLLLPFFLLACLLSWMFGYDVDGYSYLFQCSVSIAAVFYAVLGLIFLRKFLLCFFDEKITAITLILIFFGTNLLYYTVFEASISHVYSFFAVSAFLFFTYKAFRELKRKYFLLSAFFLALIILLRPVNGIIILALPFLAGSLGSLGYALYVFLKDKKTLILSILIGSSVLFLQLLLYKIQTGSFFVYSYKQEGFNFLHPEIMNVLFSYRKGLFVYTSLVFVALFGLIPLFRKNRFQFFSLLFLLMVVTWVISSWWMWFYGGSFGQRSFIEFFPLFAFLIALLLHSAKKWLKILLSLPLLFLLYLNLVQTYQKSENILPWDNVTKEIYWTIFLQTGMEYRNCFTPPPVFWPPDEWSLQRKIILMNDMEHIKNLDYPKTQTDAKVYAGKYASVIGGENVYSSSFRKKITDIAGDSTLQIRVNCMANMQKWVVDAFVVFSFEAKGKSYGWNTFMLSQQIHDNDVWKKFSARVLVPENLPPDAEVTVYFINNDKQKLVYIDNFEVQFLIYIKGALDN